MTEQHLTDFLEAVPQRAEVLDYRHRAADGT
jgi:hypothetical protein